MLGRVLSCESCIMFLGLLVSPGVVVYHIIVHAFFKSSLFLLAGSIIHGSAHYQNVFKLSIPSALIGCFLLNSLVLCLASSFKWAEM